MREDQEFERQRREALDAARYLRSDLVTFGRDERFATSFASALPIYWNNYYTIENAEEMSDSEAIRFFDWFVFDYHADGDGDEAKNGNLLDVYREERWDDLSTQQQAVLEQWKDAPPAGAYTLVDYEGQTLHLRDFMTGEEVEVYEPGGRGNAEPGDLILGRLLQVHDHLELGSAPAYIPEDEVEGLQEKVDAALAAFREDHPDASEADFLRQQNHLFVHHALEQAEQNGRPPVARLED
jgi:hypothetical protein